MLPYWFLFVIPAFAALQERSALVMPSRRKRLFAGMGLLISLLIGFRYQVGADWGSYLEYLFRAQNISLWSALTSGDPGYVLLNWLVARIEGRVWLVNLICGGIFAIGLVTFARQQPRPWLALVVSVPYLVIVVAMGYSRQAVAIGFAMLGLVALSRDRSTIKFVVWVGLAASFHKSAVLLIPLAALSADRGRIWTAGWVAIATAVFYYLFLDRSVDSLQYIYIERQYQSEGAALRVGMNALPATIFLAARRRFFLSRSEWRLWTIIALLALAFIPLLVLSPSSTAVDRMALYLIPLQIFVLSRLPDFFGGRDSGGLILLVIGYSALIQFVWLNFAANARSWLPYQMYPLFV